MNIQACREEMQLNKEGDELKSQELEDHAKIKSTK